MSTPASQLLKEQGRALVREFAGGNDREGWLHVFVTVVPLAAVWGFAAWSLYVSYWLTAAATVAITILMIRVFSLMHDCGHGSLFRTQKLNQLVGFFFGVLSGMPQYVWSQHHHYHHQTNGNWDRYRGPITTASIEEYEAMSPRQKWVYRTARHVAFAPLAGFVYLTFNPRFNWIRGSLALLAHVVRRKIAEPKVPLRTHASTFKTRLWKTSKEYRHQTANNLVLLSAWALLSWAMGPLAFFAIYVSSVALAGAVGLALFTVQHNFEDAYASREDGWDIDEGAIAGTSFLVMPGWLNWVTANIGYHHVHHLSSAVPCYRLVACHERYQHLFTGVRRIHVTEVPRHLKYILWDTRTQRITSIRAYRDSVAQKLDVAA